MKIQFSIPAIQICRNREPQPVNGGKRLSTQKWPSNEQKSFESQERNNTWTRKSPDVVEETKRIQDNDESKPTPIKNPEKVFPLGENPSYRKGQRKCFYANYLTISRKQLEQSGFADGQISFAMLLRTKHFEIFRCALIIIYLLFTLSIIAAESAIYDDDSGALAVHIIELVFMVFFVIEITMYLIAFGLKNYLKVAHNPAFILITLLYLIWILLDIIDSDVFRFKGAFRVLRVLLIVLRFTDLRCLIELRY